MTTRCAIICRAVGKIVIDGEGVLFRDGVARREQSYSVQDGKYCETLLLRIDPMLSHAGLYPHLRIHLWRRGPVLQIISLPNVPLYLGGKIKRFERDGQGSVQLSARPRDGPN
jgi:hypothetical protein